jgi:valyl-tRNA synthetase
VLRLYAPFLPFVTEEVWSWWQQGSVHRAPWPDPAQIRPPAGPADAVIDAASAAIGSIRKAKSQARLPMKSVVRRLVVTAGQEHLDALAATLRDVQAAGRVEQVELRRSDVPEPVHEVVL